VSTFLTVMLAGDPNLTEILKSAADPIFAGAQLLIPIIVLLIGIHKMVDHRTENHTVLLAEIFGFIVVSEGAVMALKKMIGI
jgi:hypothetical protein